MPTEAASCARAPRGAAVSRHQWSETAVPSSEACPSCPQRQRPDTWSPRASFIELLSKCSVSTCIYNGPFGCNIIPQTQAYVIKSSTQPFRRISGAHRERFVQFHERKKYSATCLHGICVKAKIFQ